MLETISICAAILVIQSLARPPNHKPFTPILLNYIPNCTAEKGPGFLRTLTVDEQSFIRSKAAENLTLQFTGYKHRIPRDLKFRLTKLETVNVRFVDELAKIICRYAVLYQHVQYFFVASSNKGQNLVLDIDLCDWERWKGEQADKLLTALEMLDEYSQDGNSPKLPDAYLQILETVSFILRKDRNGKGSAYVPSGKRFSLFLSSALADFVVGETARNGRRTLVWTGFTVEKLGAIEAFANLDNPRRAGMVLDTSVLFSFSEISRRERMRLAVVLQLTVCDLYKGIEAVKIVADGSAVGGGREEMLTLFEKNLLHILTKEVDQPKMLQAFVEEKVMTAKSN